MLRLTIFLSLFWVSLSLDLNGGLTKKYAFMKIMSGCLGEDFVMMIKEQMMKACAECHGRDMNDTQQLNLDYLMNSVRRSQQHIPMTPLTQSNPMYVYQPFVYPIFPQSPYSASPFQQFYAFQQFQDPQLQQSPLTRHTSLPAGDLPLNVDTNPNIPHGHELQPNPFSHHTTLQIGGHHFHFPNHHNNPPGHLTSVAPQHDLTNLQNQYGLIDERIKDQDISQDPLLPNAQFRSPFPNTQLGYPDSVHHERQFSPDSVHHERQFFDVNNERQTYELNPQPVVEAQKRKKRSLPLSPEDLETLENNLSIKIGNMTCVFREMGWLTEENDMNFTFIEHQIKNLNLNMKLEEDLIYSHTTCKDFSMCMPSEKSKNPLVREMGGALSYMKCMNTKAVTACMKHDFRMYQAKMGYGSEDTGGLPMVMFDLLGNENTDPSQLVDDIGSLVFADDAELPL